MKHFGIFSPPTSGHLNPVAALGRELQQRGHLVTCFQTLDLKKKIEAEGIGYHPIGESDFPLGAIPRILANIGARKGLPALRLSLQAINDTAEMICREGAQAIRKAGVNVLLVNQSSPEGACLADHLSIPYVSLSMALPYNREPYIPPPFTPWPYAESLFAKYRNQLGYKVSDFLTSSITNTLRRIRTQWKLEPYRRVEDSFSKLLQISQLVSMLDFPRKERPESFHYVGPLRRAHGESAPFPWESLDGRPIVFGSLGTQQGSKQHIFQCFAEACAQLDLQLVIAHGGNLSPEGVRKLSKLALVVSYAPQVELMQRAVLTLTHAGMNTVLDSLSCMVPVIAVPITYEQPAIARRVEWAGVGRMIALGKLNTDRLRSMITEVLAIPSYRENAKKAGSLIRDGGGIIKAAELIERAVRKTSDLDITSNNRFKVG